MLLAATGRAAAQPRDPPGPWAIDVRGATATLPADAAFFPPISVDTLVPSRGFGFDVGAHVYLLTLGPARLGVGANYLRVRGTRPAIATTLSTLAPQLSFNFGTTDGWSYLSAGVGRAWVKTEAAQVMGTATRDSGALTALNYGGGARWFLSDHIAVGFDVRFERLLGTPGASLLALAVGFSVR
jgi:hypothetical protein